MADLTKFERSLLMSKIEFANRYLNTVFSIYGKVQNTDIFQVVTEDMLNKGAVVNRLDTVGFYGKENGPKSIEFVSYRGVA